MKNKFYIIVSSVLFSVVIWGSVTLSDQFFSSMSFDVKVINNPNGYTYGDVKPQNILIRLKASGWQLLNLKLSSVNEFLVSADNDSGMISVDPFNEISENTSLGAGISILDINPRKISYKKIKVDPLADVSFQSGFGLATPVRVYPDSVLIAGPMGLLENLESVKTYQMNLKELDGRTMIVADLNIPPGFETLQKKAELTFDVQRIVEKSFDQIKVELTDLPLDRDVVLIPNLISCSLRGGVNLLGKISSDQIRASVSYRDIILDTLGSIKPKISIPNNTQLLFSRPEKLRYIIKKFE